MKKFSVVLAVMLMAAMLLAACKPAAPAAVEEPAEEVVMEEPAEPFDVVMVTDSAGIGDKSFNDAVWKGLQQAMTDYDNVTAVYIESKSADDYTPNLQAAVDAEPDMIICVGFMMSDACEASVKANPDIYYVSIDIDWLAYPNLLGQGAYMDQSSFLAGYVSAGMTKGKLAGYTGFFGPVVQIFLDGFWMGMTKYNEVHGTSVEMLGYDPAAMDETAAIGSWIDVDAGRALSETFLDNGADIFYPVCGNVGVGTAAAIVDRETANPEFVGYIFGMDQDWLLTNPQYAPQILGSALKKMDVVVYSAIKNLVETGTWIGGTGISYILTLENGGTEIVWNTDIDIPADLLAEAEAFIPKIISGEQATLSPEFLAANPRQ